MDRKTATHQGSPETVRPTQGAADEAIRVSEAAEREELVESLLNALEARGVPQGAWLVDINRIRQALQEADSLLRRLEDAIIRAASSPSRPE
jgi:DNA-binding LytR/AlgR family response regulator